MYLPGLFLTAQGVGIAFRKALRPCAGHSEHGESSLDHSCKVTDTQNWISFQIKASKCVSAATRCLCLDELIVLE